MDNKNHTLIVVLLTIIATTLVLGTIYLFTHQKTLGTESVAINTQKTKEVLSPDQPTETTKNEEKPVFQAGETVLITKNEESWKCSSNGDPCENILVTTEIDLTKASMGDELTGRFFIRAYNGTDYKSSPKLDELQITQNFHPFAGDGGGAPVEVDTEEILTIKTSEKPQATDESKFKDKFYLDYVNSIPGWNGPGYVLHVENEEDQSDFNSKHVDFYYSNGELHISVPQ